MAQQQKRVKSNRNHLPEERLVAFIDILGFHGKVEEMSKKADIYERVRRTLEIASDKQVVFRRLLATYKEMGAEEPLAVFEGLQMAHFSDNVVFSLPIDPNRQGESGDWLIFFASYFASRLLRGGILVRGGIARGWTYHERNILFGQGMLAAHELESRVARVPRIVVADGVAKQASAVAKWRLKRDSDGVWYIDLFADLMDLTDDRVSPPDLELFLRIGGKLRRELADAQRRHHPDPEVVAKIRWLANEFNVTVKKNAPKWPVFEGVEKIEID